MPFQGGYVVFHCPSSYELWEAELDVVIRVARVAGNVVETVPFESTGALVGSGNEVLGISGTLGVCVEGAVSSGVESEMVTVVDVVGSDVKVGVGVT